jgi:hypothetical protein
MNLFRELNQRSRPSFEFKRVQLGFHVYACIASLALFLFMQIPKYRAHKAFVADMTQKKEEFDVKLQELLQKADKIAESEKGLRIAAAKAMKDQEEAIKDGQNRSVAVISSSLDGTWTAVMWKLITFAEAVLVQRIEMGGAGDGQSQNAEKKVIIEGAAKDLAALTSWVESLSVNLPSSSFVVERHSVGTDKGFPVNFRLSARIL